METKRLCQRYIDEIVVPFSLCPWAAPALAAGRVQMHVITDLFGDETSMHEAARQVIERLDHTPLHIELALVILPRCEYSRLQMDDLLRAVRHMQRPVGIDLTSPPSINKGEVSFALAAFHPDARADASTPERLIPFLRRTPDPMIQAVRTDALAKIDPDRGVGTAYFDVKNLDLAALAHPPRKPLRLRVAEANLCTYERSIAALDDRFEAILNDHRLTREALEHK